MDEAAARTRISLDLRGVVPTAEELARTGADARAELVAEWLADARFAGRVRDLWGEILLTRGTPRFLSAASYGLTDGAAFVEAVGDEPLRILGRVAEADLPWTTLVTGDWTMADETLAAIWPVQREPGLGWQPARYTDGRPGAGILTSNGFHWRYDATASNAHRKRANAASRIFLCNDMLVRPIGFDRSVNLLEEDATRRALTENPGCVNCHEALDPLASYFFGFSWVDPGNPLEASRYFPARELGWRDATGRAPAFYGKAGASLADLGHQIAADPRFPTCAVEQAWTLLLRRPVERSDEDARVRHREAFLQGGLRIKSLLASIVQDPLYLAADVPEADGTGAVPRKLMTPDLLASSVEGLTGYRWTRGGYDLLQDDTIGVRTLAGGTDGHTVTQNATQPNATLLLVQQRLAEAASIWTVTNAPERLFPGFDWAGPEEDPAGFVRQVQALHLAVLGASVTPEGPEVAAAGELWIALQAIERDPRTAWAGVLAALLRDPEFLAY
jgi:hypothetical protein